MTLRERYIIYDSIKNFRELGEFKGSCITKCKNDTIIFSDKLYSNENIIEIPKGLKIGFESISEQKKEAFSKSARYEYDIKKGEIDYSVLVPEEEIEQFDQERFSETFPYAINLLHSAGLYLSENNFKINHLNFFKGEILKNPVALIRNGICLADRVVIDQQGDPIFYGALIIGRNEENDLSVSYESIVNVDDELIDYIIILGIEAIKD
ncbi:MAG: hypothetical protein BAJALOKI3v1_960002 [Promethearchaeota archaeon]|nr:MAG: hypothetical protein BAJALOKI3v1_960002 [Candidatus Lokiarchaeota archaeon]